VAALAYVLLPVTGLVAYLSGSSPRTRFHGLQAIIFGTVWPFLLYAATWTTPVVTQVVFLVGLLVWMALMAGAAFGRDFYLPLVGPGLRSAAETKVAEDSGLHAR
jgi:uncharacterized membrane protein